MVLNPRLPVNEDPLHDHDAASGATAGGSIVKLQADGTIAKITSSGQVPYGILFNNVKSPIPGLPQNFLFPGELGSVDAFLGDPVLVYVGAGGLFETTHYSYEGSSGIDAGAKLYCLSNTSGNVNDGKLVNSATPASGVVVQEAGAAKVIAIATQPLTDAEASVRKPLAIKMLL
jgi:hypothetical protein